MSYQFPSTGGKDDEDINRQLPAPSYAMPTNSYFQPSMNPMFGMSQWPQMVMPFGQGYNHPQAMMTPQHYFQAMPQFQQQQGLMLPPFRQQPQYFASHASYYPFDRPLASIENSSRDPSIDSLTTGASAAHLTSSPEAVFRPSELTQQHVFNCAACSQEDDANMVTCAMESCQMTFHLSCAALDEVPDGPFICESCGQHVLDETMRRHNEELAIAAMSRVTSHQSLPQVPVLKSQTDRASPQSNGSSYHPSPSPAPVSKSKKASATVSSPKFKIYQPQKPGEKKKYIHKASVKTHPYDNYGDKLFGPYGSTITVPSKRKARAAVPQTSTIRPTVIIPVPENNSLPNQKGAWSSAEDALCIQLMHYYVDTRDTHKIPIERMWAHVAADMAKQGFSRTGSGVKMQWTRRLREQCGLDERARPNPDQMKTGLLKREKGQPRNRRVKGEKKAKKEKVKTGRVAKKSAIAAATRRTRKGKKKEEEEGRKFELDTSPATDVEAAKEEAEKVDDGMALVAAYNSEHDNNSGDDDDYADQLALDEDEQHMVGMGHEEQQIMGGEGQDITMEWMEMEQVMSDDVQAGLDEGYNTRHSSYFSDAFEEMDTVMG